MQAFFQKTLNFVLQYHKFDRLIRVMSTATIAKIMLMIESIPTLIIGKNIFFSKMNCPRV